MYSTITECVMSGPQGPQMSFDFPHDLIRYSRVCYVLVITMTLYSLSVSLEMSSAVAMEATRRRQRLSSNGGASETTEEPAGQWGRAW
jgi:hypothetical protein